MLNILIYFISCFLIFFLSSKLAYKFNLVDKPNKRKIHSKATAYTGGITISLILLIAIKLFDFSNESLNLIISISFLIACVGFIDDKFNLTVSSKLSLQSIPIFYLIIVGNLTLEDIGYYQYFHTELGAFAIPFTLISVLFLINSFNYFDGMDGTLSFSSISVIIILYFLIPDQNFQIFLKIIFIPIIVFLFFNFSLFKLPKLFLGDSGSLFLGFLISFILIYIAKKNFTHPILLAWAISIFVFEFLSINLIRLKNNISLFQAGQDHLHHLILEKTNSYFKTNLTIFFLNIIIFLIGYITFLKSPLASLILFLFLFIFYLFIRQEFSKKN